jgi:DNA-binding LacI/PurR family transcriptional regulator
VAIPFEELGRTAISMFWERREQNRIVDKAIKLSPFLVDRHSVAKIDPSSG